MAERNRSLSELHTDPSLQPVCLDANRVLNTAAIEASRKVNRYFTPAGSNSIKYSSYGARVAIVEQRALDRPKLFETSIDQSRLDQYNGELAELQARKAEWARKAADNMVLDGEYRSRIEALDQEKAELTAARENQRLPVRNWMKAKAKLGQLYLTRDSPQGCTGLTLA